MNLREISLIAFRRHVANINKILKSPEEIGKLLAEAMDDLPILDGMLQENARHRPKAGMTEVEVNGIIASYNVIVFLALRNLEKEQEDRRHGAPAANGGGPVVPHPKSQSRLLN
ncbi:MAG: hypothetical protein H6819_02275 [Phycisphaerales bacterium]|nr:hypothetical protein [Phycisphaerales bacterium]MCB9856961.1 hypothetical protein [Phycisphaerales bacterium]MCB9861912.1 hypothetical protein [Phycisphaerales bacterium]